MHLNFHFTAVQVIWTLSFAALLVLLVVLLGRDRIQRFPWFTASIVLMALRLLASRMLFNRLPPLTLSTIFLTMADIGTLIGMLVIVELARRAFKGAKWQAWLAGTLAVLAVGIAVVIIWGPWPSWKTLTSGGSVAILRFMQLGTQKGDLLIDLLAIELGILVVLFGRRFGAGWKSHTQQILIGLSTAGLGQVAMRGLWQAITATAIPHSRAEYERVMGLQDKLYNANGVVYLVVILWWIVCLWRDERGSLPAERVPELAHTGPLLTGGAAAEPETLNG